MQNKYNKDTMKNDMAEGAKHLAHKAEDKFNEMKEGGKDMAHNLEKKAYEMGEKARDTYHQVEEMAKCGATELESQIKARPFITIGAAFLIGMLLGKLSK